MRLQGEPAAQTITAQQLLQLPDDGYRYELVAGELLRMPPAGAEHGGIALNIGALLRAHVKARNLGMTCAAETGFVLQRNPDLVRAPDVSFVATARFPAEGIPRGYWPTAPDLAVEVVSPNDRSEDVQGKVAEYLSAGTRMVWVVYPKTQMVFVYRSPSAVQALNADEEISGEDVVPGFSCRVEEFFS